MSQITGLEVIGPFEAPPLAEAERAEPMLQMFRWGHLPANLQGISRPFCQLAYNIALLLPRNPERTVALRKLLEAKDAAVRAAFYRMA